MELERVIDDLKVIAAAAVRQKKKNGQPVQVVQLEEELDRDLAVDFDDYVTFLEKADCVELDRSRERMQLLERVTLALKTPDQWSELVADTFGRVVDADVTFGEEETGEAESTSQEGASAESDSAGADSDAEDESESASQSRSKNRVPSPSKIDKNSESSGKARKEAAARESGGDRDEARGEDTESEDDRSEENDGTERSAAEAANPRVPGTPRDEVGSEPSTPASGARYDHVGEVGSGGFGTVYKARDTALDRVVAIKEIRNIFDVFAQLDPDDVGRRFATLTRSQAKLSHPGIVEVHDLDTSGEFPFAVTEYAPSGSLRRFTDLEGEGDLRVALEYFVQILHGLKAAHDAGLIHGNIKPENVVLDRHGNAKLSDFGLTKLVALDDTVEQVYIGVSAVEYKAPEQLKSRDTETVKSDIYSLGMLFYEMLTGEVPGRRSPMPSEFNSDIPDAVDVIFDRMASDDPGERYESVDEILVDFFSADGIVRLFDRRSGVVFLDDPIEGEHRGKPPVGETSSVSRDRGSSASRTAAEGDSQLVPATQGEGPDAATAQVVQDNRSWWQKLFG